MNLSIVLTLLLVLAQGESEAARTQRERLLKLHLGDALEYTMYRDASQKEKLEFQKQPVYVWTNLVRTSQQDGVVFVWTSRGRPEAIGTIFSSGGGGKRGLTHEFHSLSLGALDVTRQGTHATTWKPRAAGIELTPIERAPAPAGSAAQRLVQMRTLAREFSATTHDAEDRQWELRLLSQPLYRYESTDGEVLDGALFAFVTSAGTDPEALLVIEARQPAGGGMPVWYRALARFTDLELKVRFKGNEVLSAPMIRGDILKMYPKQQYRVIADRVISDSSQTGSSRGPRPLNLGFFCDRQTPLSPRAGHGGRPVLALAFSVGVFAVYLANGREIFSGDTVPTKYLTYAVIRGDGFYLDRYRREVLKWWPYPGMPYYAEVVDGHYVSRYPIGPVLGGLSVRKRAGRCCSTGHIRGWETGDPAVVSTPHHQAVHHRNHDPGSNSAGFGTVLRKLGLESEALARGSCRRRPGLEPLGHGQPDAMTARASRGSC